MQEFQANVPRESVFVVIFLVLSLLLYYYRKSIIWSSRLFVKETNIMERGRNRHSTEYDTDAFDRVSNT